MTTYHIRDTATGLFYAGTDFIPSATEPKTVPKFTNKGKTFLDLGKIKAHINFLIGMAMPPRWLEEKQDRLMRLKYDTEPYNALREEINAWSLLHPGYRSVPEFLDNPYRWDSIPETWEVVAVHNRQKGEQEVVDFSPAQYAMLNQRLRNLTDNFGVAVKEVFKKIEAKGALERFRWVVVIGPDLPMLRSTGNWWINLNTFRPDTAQVDAVLKQMGTKRTDVVRASKEFSVALAFGSMPEAAMFRLAYTGEMKARVLDMAKLEEAVEP